MRFPKQAVQLAVLALTLVPMFAFAAPKSKVAVEGMPNLTVASINRSSETTLTIRNDGDVASAPCHVRIEFSTGAVYHFQLWEMPAGSEVQIQAPAARDGKPFTITVAVDCDGELAESNEDDNFASVRYLD